MVDNIDKAFSDLTDPNRVINTEGFGTDFVKIAEQSSEDLEELGITSDDIAPKYSYPLLIDEEYPIKLVFTAYEIDFRQSDQWNQIKEQTEIMRKSVGKGVDHLIENPLKGATAVIGGGAGGYGLGGMFGKPKTGAALGAISAGLAATEELDNFGGALGETIKVGATLTSYDNYSSSTNPKGTVILPLQRGLQYNDKVSYNQQSTNFGQGIISAGASMLSGEGGEISDAAAGGVSQLVARATGGALGGTVGAALSKLPFGGMGIGTVAGVIGAEPLANFAKEVSRISMNPNLRTLFDNVPMRGFSFPFRMVAKSEKEAQEIRNIVKFFRGELYPEAVNAGQDNNIPFAYKFPNVFDIQLKDSTGKNPAFKIQRCYLTGVNTTFNQTATGMYKGNDGNYFIEVDMSLEFIEIVTMDKAKVEKGGF
jgi:hypothetical protein